MKVPKDKLRVNIFCVDGSIVSGFVYISEGLRLLDFMNHEATEFLVVTDAQFQGIKEIHSFKLLLSLSKQKRTVILNKHSIKWIEEAGKGE